MLPSGSSLYPSHLIISSNTHDLSAKMWRHSIIQHPHSSYCFKRHILQEKQQLILQKIHIICCSLMSLKIWYKQVVSQYSTSNVCKNPLKSTFYYGMCILLHPRMRIPCVVITITCKSSLICEENIRQDTQPQLQPFINMYTLEVHTLLECYAALVGCQQ